MEKHVNIIAILWIALGAMSFFGGFMAFGILLGISFIPDIGVEAPIILRTLIVSFFSLLNFPLGTALGIYSFVILIKEETTQLFKS